MKLSIFLAGIILVSTGLVRAEGTDVGKAGEAMKNRDPQATDEVFTPQYLEQVNLEKQAADSQRERDRIRHDKVVDFYLRGHH
jgi:hypothetical protein